MFRILAIALLVLTAAAVPAAAEYPERPITVLTGYPAGGMVDIVARALAEGMKKKFPKGIGVVTPARRRRLARRGRDGAGPSPTATP